MGIMNELGKYVIDGDYEINANSDETGKLEDFTEAGVALEKGFTVEDADPKELAIGSKIEMEHTINPKFAERIALDHLSEIPDYYTRLVAMEREAGIDLDELLNY